MQVFTVIPQPRTEWQATDPSEIELTNRHKTGYIGPVALHIRDDQIPLLDHLRKTFQAAYNFNPKYVFGNTISKCKPTASSQVTNVFKKFFGDDPQKLKFNSNSIRKYRDTRNNDIRGQLSDVRFVRTHFAQAAHCEKTALKNYVHPNNCKNLRAEVPA